MGARLATCLPFSVPWQRSERVGHFEMEPYQGSGDEYKPLTSHTRAEAREQERKANIRKDMDMAIQRLHRVITSRNQQIHISERQTLRYGRLPGDENRRWALHYFRSRKRMRARVEQHHKMLETLQLLRAEMHMAEDMADAYAAFAKYSKEFSTVVEQLRNYNVEDLMDEMRENMQSVRDIEVAVDEGITPEQLLREDELEEFNREFSALEAAHARSSLDEYLYAKDGDDRESDEFQTEAREEPARDTRTGALEGMLQLFE